ncbi:MAG: hypothetical protein LBB14_03545 [Puniceicoccales bacterium]|nr:hypothetical protein [Puniceicoccales bacterium]
MASAAGSVVPAKDEATCDNFPSAAALLIPFAASPFTSMAHALFINRASAIFSKIAHGRGRQEGEPLRRPLRAREKISQQIS